MFVYKIFWLALFCHLYRELQKYLNFLGKMMGFLKTMDTEVVQRQKNKLNCVHNIVQTFGDKVKELVLSKAHFSRFKVILTY